MPGAEMEATLGGRTQSPLHSGAEAIDGTAGVWGTGMSTLSRT